MATAPVTGRRVLRTRRYGVLQLKMRICCIDTHDNLVEHAALVLKQDDPRVSCRLEPPATKYKNTRPRNVASGKSTPSPEIDEITRASSGHVKDPSAKKTFT